MTYSCKLCCLHQSAAPSPIHKNKSIKCQNGVHNRANCILYRPTKANALAYHAAWRDNKKASELARARTRTSMQTCGEAHRSKNGAYLHYTYLKFIAS